MDIPEAGCSITAQRLVEDQLDLDESHHKDRMLLVYWREFYVSFIFLGAMLLRAQVLYWLSLCGVGPSVLSIAKGLYLWLCLMILCRTGIDANPMYTLLGCLRKSFQVFVQGEMQNGVPRPVRFLVDFVLICASVFTASLAVVYLFQLTWPEMTARSTPPPRPFQIMKVEFFCTVIQMLVQVYQPMYSKMFGNFAALSICCLFPCFTDSVGASINPIMAVALVIGIPTSSPALVASQIWAYSVPPLVATFIVVSYEGWIYHKHMNELSLSTNSEGPFKLKED